jgi:predicted RNase H-like HicB family nuclease
MDLNTEDNRNQLISVFPDLAHDKHFKVKSPETDTYNCIAWAMGYDNVWVVPVEEIPGYWWPVGATKGMALENLIEAFKFEGFEESDNALPEDGYDKVALYGNDGCWTHASKVVSPNVEHSKFGQSWDGEHSHGVLCKTSIGCERCSYGTVYTYMKRKSGQKGKYIPKGTITIDTQLLNRLMGK